MNRLLAIPGLVCLVTSSFVAIGADGPESLNPTLDPYLKEFGLPALSAAVFKNGMIIAAGAVGTRRAGENIPVAIDDKFHLGSDSKAFTALLAGWYVQQGKLRWDSTLGEIFPELKDKMDPEFAKITVEELLSHSSGITDNTLGNLIDGSYRQDGNMDEVRYWMLKETAPRPLDHPRGTKFSYSNLGYTFAGAVLERLSGKTWEELVQEKIIEPMGLKTAGFGPQASLGKVDQPLGHAIVDGKPKPMLAGPNGDNPLIIGPAGTMHMSVLDFAKWVAWHAGEGKHGPALVSADTLKKLHTPVIAVGERKDAAAGTPKSGGGYALGWGKVQPTWASAPMLSHDGSNTSNLATAEFWPDTDFGFVIMTNISGKEADDALHRLAEALYKQFGNGK
ncbi:MAG: beta-lactamase family protein [Verrucomicrobia bacterium]|nr:beta-lactamase family protein [Verrucomicrobiota bacterium]